MSWRCALLIHGSKGQGHNALITKNGICGIIDFPLHLSSWNFTCRLPMSWGCVLLILGSKRSKVKVTMHWLLKMVCCIIALPLHLSSWNFTHRLPMSWGCVGVKRSRSQCIDYWKWYMSHNCFSFTPVIMKLHMQTPHELRICPIDFGVKRSKVKVPMLWFLKMVYVS